MSKNQSKHTVVQRGKELRNIKCHYTSFEPLGPASSNQVRQKHTSILGGPLNCKGDHAADDNKCSFWRHRFDKQWHSNKAAEGRSGRANHSNINSPSGGSQ